MKSKHSAFPWEQLLRVSYTQLGIPPEVFWQMTPGEWLLLVRDKCVPEARRPISQRELLEMIRLFPDEAITAE